MKERDLERVFDSLIKKLEHSPDGNCGDSCKQPGCPAHVHYDHIDHEDKIGWMFIVNNLLVWKLKAECQVDRDEETFTVSLCEAKGRQLI